MRRLHRRPRTIQLRRRHQRRRPGQRRRSRARAHQLGCLPGESGDRRRVSADGAGRGRHAHRDRRRRPRAHGVGDDRWRDRTAVQRRVGDDGDCGDARGVRGRAGDRAARCAGAADCGGGVQLLRVGSFVGHRARANAQSERRDQCLAASLDHGHGAPVARARQRDGDRDGAGAAGNLRYGCRSGCDGSALAGVAGPLRDPDAGVLHRAIRDDAGAVACPCGLESRVVPPAERADRRPESPCRDGFMGRDQLVPRRISVAVANRGRVGVRVSRGHDH